MNTLKAIQILLLALICGLTLSTAYADLNPHASPTPGAKSPETEVSPPQSSNGSNSYTEKPNHVCASILECENQTLGESIPVAGTPFTLNYRSDRMPGRITRITVPLTAATLPPGILQVIATVSFGGQQLTQTFAPQPNLTHDFALPSVNAYGQTLSGWQSAEVVLGYVYRAVYYSPENIPQAFGTSSGIATTNRARQEITLSQKTKIPIYVGSATTSLAGWSLNVLHSYDPQGGALFLGDGNRRSSLTKTLGAVITTVAGDGAWSNLDYYTNGGDGGPATAARLGTPAGVAVAPDGSLYIADTIHNRIRRVDTNGIISTVAGGGSSCTNANTAAGDGGPATSACLNAPYSVAVAPDGSLYIADTYNCRIRRVAPDGIITTVAGSVCTGSRDGLGDGGPATAALLNVSTGIAVAPDGNLYIAEMYGNRIRRVGTNGIISTVAGDGNIGFSGDGGPAIAASLYSPWSIAVGSDGSLYIADSSNNRIRRVGTNGIISTVAGNGNWGFSDDGGLATDTALNQQADSQPFGIAVGLDGSLYITDTYNNRVRRVSPDGIISTVVGNGNRRGSATINIVQTNGEPATATELMDIMGSAVAPDGSLYIIDSSSIRHIAPTMHNLSGNEIAIASEDGSELYVFSSEGRHIRTLNAVTGATIFAFSYDSNRHLSSITDGSGNITTVEWDNLGNPTAFVAPSGQRTSLKTNADGYLASLTNPAGENYAMTYDSGGLLTSFQTPRGLASTFNYDPDTGRLIKDVNAAGGKQVLDFTQLTNGFEVNRTTGLGLSTHYRIENLPTGDSRRTVIEPDNTQIVTLESTNGTTKITQADGTLIERVLGPDPRFGMLSPVLKSSKTQIGNLISEVTSVRTATLAKANDPLSLTSLTDTLTINGRTATSVFDAATKTTTTTSAAGRQSQTVIDNLGRVTEARVTGLESVKIGYDAKGRPANLSQGSGTNTRQMSFAYNPQGYLQSVTDPAGRSTSYQYDLAGRVIQQTLPDGNKVLFDYDKNGNLTSLMPPNQPAHIFTYDPVDQPQDYTPPNVGAGTNKTLYAYNLDKQLTQIVRPDGINLNFSYDNAGRLSKLTIPDGNLSYGYDATTSKLSTITTPVGDVLNYDYTAALLTTATWTGSVNGKVSHVYDNDFRVTTVSVNNNDPITYAYDADSLLNQAGAMNLNHSADHGLLTGTTLGKLSDSLSYNSFGEISQYTTAYDGSELLKFTYTRDTLGRITQKQEIRNGITDNYDYGYDAAGHLVEVKKNGVVRAKYTYDANGNRIKYEGAVIAEGSYDAQDRLLSYGGATYTYTANGEMTSKTVSGSVTSYQYDVLGNLKHVELPNGTKLDYLVDGQNRRIAKKVNGVLQQAFLWQGSLKPIAELDGNGNIVSRFVYATHVNVPDYMVKAGETYRIITDHLGSPRLVVRVSDNLVIQQIDYDEFGNVLLDTNPGFQPFGFAGGLYDQNTKLVRFGARDYDAGIGRWMAKDPIGFNGGDINLYGYAVNDPVNRVDPFGMQNNLQCMGADVTSAGIMPSIPNVAIAAVTGTLVGIGVTSFAGPVLGWQWGTGVGSVIFTILSARDTAVAYGQGITNIINQAPKISQKIGQ